MSAGDEILLKALSPEQSDLILGAMAQVASRRGAAPLSQADRATLTAARHYVFHRPPPFDLDHLPRPTPADLAQQLSQPALADHAVRFMTVAALVDGALDQDKIEVVLDYAQALGVTRGYVEELTQAAAGHLGWATMDMVRRNFTSITGKAWTGDHIMDWLLPYRGSGADPALADRFHALEQRPEGTLGRAFWHHYTHHGFVFPGEENGLNAVFAVPHDSTHLISDYATTYHGEILVSTFTAGMHPEGSMAAHILPVIFSWHLDIELIESAGSHQGSLDPVLFWEAWTRGAAVATDLFQPSWDFWALVPLPLDELKRRYRVPPKEAPTGTG